jgi:hypothetical protein
MSVTPKALVNSQLLTASATALYTAPADTHTIIDKFTATNSDGSSRTVTVYIVPTGSAVGTATLITSVASIATNDTYDASELKNQILNPGDAIYVLASVAGVVCVRASGRECT